MKAALLAIAGTIAAHSGHAFQTGPSIQLLPTSRLASQVRPSAGSISWYRPSPRPSPLFSTDNSADGSPTAETILDEFHQSKYPFRIVVIGNGAILETTSRLGPVSKSSVSPKSGERLLTFASEDQSFEFHVKVEQVSKIAFVATQRRVARFLSETATPICSLILAESSEEAEGWFDNLVEKHGGEIVL